MLRERDLLLVDVFPDFLEGDLEPFGIAFRVGFHVVGDVVEGHVLPGGYLVGVDDGGVVGGPEPDMVEFMFDESEAYRGLIYKGEDLVQVAVHAHLFLESPSGGFFQGLAIAGMTAAGVGPEAGGVVFRQGALLE